MDFPQGTDTDRLAEVDMTGYGGGADVVPIGNGLILLSLPINKNQISSGLRSVSILLERTSQWIAVEAPCNDRSLRYQPNLRLPYQYSSY